MTDEDCVFCKIVAGREPASFVHEDEMVVAFMDIYPINPGAAVVIPREHVPSLSALEDDVGARLFNVAVRVQRAIRGSGLRCEAIRIVAAIRKAAERSGGAG